MSAMTKLRILSPSLFWRVNLAAWFSFGAVCFLAKVYFYPHLSAGLQLLAAELLVSLILSAFLRIGYRKVALVDFFSIKTVTLVVISSFLAAFVQTVIIQGLINQRAWGRPDMSSSLAFSLCLKSDSLVLMAWSLGYFGMKAKMAARQEVLRTRDAKEAARKMELQLLRNRLEPHFLFNSLNGIAAEITPHPAAASELIHDVADYLRYLLDHRERVSSPLSEELAAMESYLKVERSRFGELLETSVKATQPARRTPVPCFLLQPLVENAVKHARWPAKGPLKIDILSTREKSGLIISVSNTGELKSENHRGVGLSTLQRLLELHYPNRHEFTIENRNGLVVAKLTLQGLPCSAS